MQHPRSRRAPAASPARRAAPPAGAAPRRSRPACGWSCGTAPRPRAGSARPAAAARNPPRGCRCARWAMRSPGSEGPRTASRYSATLHEPLRPGQQLHAGGAPRWRLGARSQSRAFSRSPPTSVSRLRKIRTKSQRVPSFAEPVHLALRRERARDARRAGPRMAPTSACVRRMPGPPAPAPSPGRLRDGSPFAGSRARLPFN